VTAVGGSDACLLRVSDGQGRPSGVLDGCRLQSRSGRMSRPIVQGGITVPGDALHGGFGLLTEGGETLAVRRG